MKDSKEKEHRISNLKEMIDTVKFEEKNAEEFDEVEEDIELINYLNEDRINYDELEINDEFIYHPGDEKDYAVNLEENPIDENYIINTPKSEDFDEVSEIKEVDDLNDDFAGELSDNLDNIINAKIGKTPILAIISSILGAILLIISVFIFNSRADKVIDNVVSGETLFIVIIFVIIGLLLLIYGLYRIIGFKNPMQNIVDSIDSIEKDSKKKDKKEKKTPEEEKIIPKSKIPLDKESYKIGEFEMEDIKNKLKKPTTVSKPKVMPVEKDIDDIPPAREKIEKNDLMSDKIEMVEYEQIKLESESIDDIFAEVEDIDELSIISIDSKEDKKKE